MQNFAIHVITLTMGYQVEQKIKGKIYVYQVESYWDSEKKQSRQRRTYLGRKDEKTGNICCTTKASLPKSSRSVGGVYLLKKLIESLELNKVLKEVFGEGYERLLYLAMYKILTGDPTYLYEMWVEETYLPEDAQMSSQRISEYLIRIGEDEKLIEKFFNSWIKLNPDGQQAVVFDITSISSYSENITIVERGYNRDGENLEQINLGIISKEQSGACGLPLAYRIYPGSIGDVSTLSNVLELIKQYQLQLSVCVLDKGFFSQENIKNMGEKSIRFIIPMSFSMNLAKQSVSESTAGDTNNSFSYRDGVYFHSQKDVEVGGVKCVMHIYLDKEKRAREEVQFLRGLLDFESLFSQNSFTSVEAAEQYVSETLKSKQKLFTINKTNSGVLLSRNKQAIDNEISRFGFFVLITNCPEQDKSAVLSLYRQKDSAEKIFQSFKNDIREKRSRAKSDASMRGRIFISFLSLIILSKLSQTMQQKRLFNSMTKQELLKIVSSLKVFTLANNLTLVAEQTHKQKDAFAAFGIKKIDPSYNLAGF